MTSPERPEQAPITSTRSDRVRRIAALSGRSARRRTGLLRVDGPQAVRSLLAERPALARELYLTADADAAHPELRELAAGSRATVRVVGEDIIRAMVRADTGPGPDGRTGPTTGTGTDSRAADDVATPQGAVAVADRPDLAWPDAVAALPADDRVTVLVLDEVRDPGNAGTLIRTADAAGAQLVVLTASSTDPYAPKAVRSSAGSIFHLPVVTDAPASELLAALASRGVAVAATSGHAELDLFEAALPARIAWVMGNEARGVAPSTLASADLAVRIPLQGRAESLNVATAATVCLFESLRRHRAAP